MDYLHRYRVVKALGSGASGTVFMVQHCAPKEGDEAFYVLKQVILCHDVKNPGQYQYRLLSVMNEIQNLKIVNHAPEMRDHFVHMFGHQSGNVKIQQDEKGNFYFQQTPPEVLVIHILLKYYPDGDLFSQVEMESLTTRDKLNIYYQLMGIVHYLYHVVGMVHRDIKPENILVEKSASGFHVVLADFGGSQLRNAESSFAMGSDHYIDPEIVLGRNVTLGSELWSCHVLFYVLFVGDYPYKMKSVNGRWFPEQVKNIFYDYRFNPATKEICYYRKRLAIPADVPDHIRRYLREALHPHPKRRFSWEEVVEWIRLAAQIKC